MSLNGQVFGGQQGVIGAQIQLYTVGTGGNGTAATAMLNHPAVTGTGGSFNITNDYTCPSPSKTNPGASNQVYLVATGGDPGVGSSNAALTMVVALGPCSNLSATSTIFVNEVTTVAAAWALAPFATSAPNIAASSGNVSGITNAFLDAGLLANSSNGAPAILPGNLSIETDKLNALADALASCVNSDGGTACTPLFSAATEGKSVPTDTFTAALNIVKHPGTNVAKVFDAIGTYVPFATSMDAPPNDWTMSLTVTGGGLSSPTALAVDAEGNVWAANLNGPLSAFGPQGTPMSDTGFTNGGLSESYGLTIDTNGDVWVANNTGGLNGNGSVSKFYGATSTMGSAGTVVSSGYTNYINYPFALASDTNGNVFVANSQNGSATVLTTNGTVYTTPDNTFSGYLELGFGFPIQSIAVDTNHGFWMPNGDHVVGHFSADGAQESLTNCCFGAQALALDNTGAVWVANYDGNTISELDSTGAVHVNQKAPGGIDSPDDISIDAAQNVWVSNNNSDGFSISEVAGNGGTLPLGTGISPSNAQGVYGQGGFGLDANLDSPFGLAPDRSGNIWVSNEHNDSLVMFFGIATPTITPIQPAPTAP
jgi:streptogramin lyase